MATSKRDSAQQRGSMQMEEGIDILELLTDDHQKVAQMFEDFGELDEDERAEKDALARQICLELSVHATVEEELFYPAARAALGQDGEDILNEAEVEHGSAKELIADIMAEPSSDRMFDAKIKVLAEYIRHHVDEEEGELFPLLRDSDIDLEALGAEVMQLKEHLLEEIESQAPA